jgi:hypothetical protein
MKKRESDAKVAALARANPTTPKKKPSRSKPNTPKKTPGKKDGTIAAMDGTSSVDGGGAPEVTAEEENEESDESDSDGDEDDAQSEQVQDPTKMVRFGVFDALGRR